MDIDRVFVTLFGLITKIKDMSQDVGLLLVMLLGFNIKETMTQ